MSDMRIILSAAATRQVLSLQEAQRLSDRTAARLASGLAVADPADDAQAFFAARGLNQAAEAFLDRSRALESAIGLVSAALIGAQAIGRTLRVMEGLLATAQPKYGTYLEGLRLGSTDQTAIARGDAWDDLIDQIKQIADDSSFEGRNLIGDADPTDYSWRPSSVTVQVGPDSKSLFTLPAQFLGNVYVSEEINGGLPVIRLLQGDAIGARGGTVFPTETGRYRFVDAAQTVRADGGVTYVVVPGPTIESRPVIRLGTPSTGAPGAAPGAGFTPAIPGANLYLRVIKPDGYLSTTTLYQTVNVVVPGDPSTVEEPVIAEPTRTTPIIGLGLMTSGMYDSFVTSVGIEGARVQLDRAKDIVRATEARLGAALAFLRKRLDFNRAVASEQQEGAAKYTRANLNLEGARLVAIQTRQQFGIAGLSRVVVREGAILALFQTPATTRR